MRKLFMLTILLAGLLLTSCSNREEAAVEQLAQRITNGTAGNRIEFKLLPSQNAAGTISRDQNAENGISLAQEPEPKEFFEITPVGKKVRISGNTQSALTAGLNWYLKYVADIHISWNNLTQDLPEVLPLPAATIRHETEQTQRYYLNYCTHSYSMPFWNWERWEQEIDWMALHGINLPLHIVGVDVVWRNVLKRLDYSQEDIDAFIAGPAYHAWWLMNNLEGWGGPKPDSWYKDQEVLSKKISARMKSLGIAPVVPGYAGTVPSTSAENLGFDIVDTGKWCAFSRPAFLSTEDPNFQKMAALYYEELEKVFGKVDYFSMDPFHEGGKTEGIDLAAAGQAIMGAMKATNPDAVWVAQSWQACPYDAMIHDLKNGDLLVLDLYSEKRPQWGDPDSIWYRPDGFQHHDWLYCMLLNFGGNVGLHGRMEKVVNGFYDAKAHVKGATLKGVGTTPEGIENNPVMFELLYELPWRESRFSCEEWLDGYLRARYGRDPEPEVKEAWSILKQTVYNAPTTNSGEGTVESVLCARPGFDLRSTSTWGWAELFYPAEKTAEAAALMQSVAGHYKGNRNFMYDLTDITRQSISDEANQLLKAISSSYHNKDVRAFRQQTGRFLELLLRQDELLSTCEGFSLQEWVRKAEQAGHTPEEMELYRKNALMLITVWGDEAASEAGGLHEYSHREWSGLLKGLYYERWKMFFDATLEELETGHPAAPINWYEFDSAWIEEQAKKESGSEIVSIDALRNPDRGYHIEAAFKLPEEVNPFNNVTRFTADTYRNSLRCLHAEQDSITLVQQYFYLTPYLEKELDEAVFQSMERIFDQLEKDGINTILRYAYNYQGLGCPAGETEERVIGHIHQITPFLRSHIGQIATLQSGFFGAWGEWHTSNLYGNQEAKNHIVSALLEAVPEPYCVQIRYPVQKRKITLDDESQRGRLGFNNDYFTAGEHSHAPENDYVGVDYSYVKEEAEKYNPYILAEIPYAEKTEWGLHELISTDKTLQILNQHRYSAFDITQNTDLNIRHWKTVKVSASYLDSLGIRYDHRYFEDGEGKEVVRSFYQFVRDHLGYRINVKEGAKVKKAQKAVNYDFTLTNSGFARPMYPGEAYLVLMKDNEICGKTLLTDCIRDWMPMKQDDPKALAEYHYSGKLKADGLSGNYMVGIWIPKSDEAARYHAVQDIKIAPNGNVRHFWTPDQKYAINVIGEVCF